jgi:glycine/sarcosine/betaine reductase complex component C subunit beta
MAAVVKQCAYVLVHVPSFIRYGSKPDRDILVNGGPGGELENEISRHIRSFNDAVAYPPNQVFIGNMAPETLNSIPQPWFQNPIKEATRQGRFGEIVPEEEFYGWVKMADDFDLLWLTPEFMTRLRQNALNHPFLKEDSSNKLRGGIGIEKIEEKVKNDGALPLYHRGEVVGCIRRDHDADDTLKAGVLLENLMTKASAAIAVRHLLRRAEIGGERIDFLLSCSEEAVGDRYNRGGGSLAKAIAEMCHCMNASGHDIKAFCAAPIHAIINAACQVEAGLFERVVVVGGGCLAKLGMKYSHHIRNGMPILEDVLGGFAFLIARDDGNSPRIRLDCVGKHEVSSGSNQQDILTSLVLKPLDRIGMRMMQVDKYATELHNPEITVPAGSGNTPLTNYRLMGALASLRKEIDRTQIDAFVKERGMPGFSSTQGHIPSAVPFLGHALDAMARGEMDTAMFLGKGSLFLGRMSHLSDGMSFLLERNSKK